MDFRSSVDSVTFTWPQQLLKMVEVREDPGINEVLEQFLSNTSTVACVASKGSRSHCVPAAGCWGLVHTCCWGSFSVELKILL